MQICKLLIHFSLRKYDTEIMIANSSDKSCNTMNYDSPKTQETLNSLRDFNLRNSVHCACATGATSKYVC